MHRFQNTRELRPLRNAFSFFYATLAGAVTVVVPRLVLACPGSGGHASSCGMSMSLASTLSALGVGLAIGLGSSALEGIFKKKA